MGTSDVVVLGATGGAGSAVVHELASRGIHVRVVSRSGRGLPLPGVTAVKADAMDPAGLRDVCRDAAVNYHCVNVSYQLWSKLLLPIAEAVIASAAAGGAKLVVMDNLYM